MMNEEGLNSSGRLADRELETGARIPGWPQVISGRGGDAEKIQGGTGETQMRVKGKQKSKCGTEKSSKRQKVIRQ